MNMHLVERIANAVLYEGYILYPYRPSAVKNRQRWNFGALSPEAYSAAHRGTEAWTMQTECLVEGDERTTLDVKIRFLHLLAREVGELTTGEAKAAGDDADGFHRVASLEVDGKIFQTWQEAVAREVALPRLSLTELVGGSPQRQAFAFASSRERERLLDASGEAVGAIERHQEEINGAVEVAGEGVGEGLFKITARILNLTALDAADRLSRDEAMMHTLVSSHTILGVQEGKFVSLLDPPEACREVVAACRNEGTWPVLVGEEGERDCMLSSPIILYDYPQIAPESPGDLFDGMEIDEILTLRIMTLTDEEKREMRSADEYARRILERTETLPAEQLMKLHGAMSRPKEK